MNKITACARRLSKIEKPLSQRVYPDGSTILEFTKERESQLKSEVQKLPCYNRVEIGTQKITILLF